MEKVAKKLSLQVKKLDMECEQLNQQCNELLNHRSEISAFLKEITQETALQQEKYSENDKTKHDPDWYRLIVYLSGKVLYNPDVGTASPVEKQKDYIQETTRYILPMLKQARRTFSKQEPAYENEKFVLRSQITLTQAILDAYSGYHQKMTGCPLGQPILTLSSTI